MIDGDRLRTDRRRIEDIRTEADRHWQGKPEAAQAVVVQTATKTAYPAAAGSYFWCEIMRVSGDPVEGGTITYTGTGQHLYAYNLGPTKPTVGTKKLARQAGGRWFISHG